MNETNPQPKLNKNGDPIPPAVRGDPRVKMQSWEHGKLCNCIQENGSTRVFKELKGKVMPQTICDAVAGRCVQKTHIDRIIEYLKEKGY